MDLEQKLEIIQIARVACGTLAIVFLLLTIFLFWKFGIVRALLERTGLAKKKAITDQKELNASTGRLKKSNAERIAAQEFTGQLTGERKRRGKSAELKTGGGAHSTPAVNDWQGAENGTMLLQQNPAEEGTMQLQQNPAEEGTMQLQQNPADEGTMLLNQGPAMGGAKQPHHSMTEEGTTLLDQNQTWASPAQPVAQSPAGYFRVIEDIQIVHSDEQI